jgi:hypothetical protein
MDQKEVLAKFEELREKCLKYSQGKYGEVDHDRLASLYGELEPIIEHILGIEEIEVELSHGATYKCKNYIEAGFLTGRTMHASVGYKHLLKVIVRIQQQPEIITQAFVYSGNKSSSDTMSIVENLCKRFHLVARQLKGRHNERQTLLVEDEYDVQDLFHALLTLYFNDIRPEEWTPSYAGGCSRMDFLLKQEHIVIEVKKTRKTLGAKELGEQLIVDIAKYEVHTDCDTLICFVYDPEGWIANPRGIENDLNKNNGGLHVKVLITPTGL